MQELTEVTQHSDEFRFVFRVEALEAAIKSLQKEVARLVASQGSEQTAPIIGVGEKYFHEGDNVPKRGSVAEHFTGKVWVIEKKPYKFVKNDTRSYLKPGAEFAGGVVDTKLKSDVEPDNFFFVEL